MTMRSKARLSWIPLAVAAWVAGCGTGGTAVPSPTPEPSWPLEDEVDALDPLDEEPELLRPARLGVVVPQSGSPVLQRYAEYVLEGVRVALEEWNETGRRPIELVVFDDSGDVSRIDSLMWELERLDVSAVIGPLRPEAVEAAARARARPDLVIVSPTAAQAAGVENVYTLNVVDTEGAAALARHALDAGMTRVALLYPRSPEYTRQARAFAEVLRSGGGEIVSDQSFPVGMTTFRAQMRVIFDVRPDAVFIPASERDVLQIAPQLAYYARLSMEEDTAAMKAAPQGEPVVPLADDSAAAPIEVQVLGSEAWVSEGVRAQVEPRCLEGVISAVPLVPFSSEVGWQDFVRLYEATHRRSLENALPALGYDAAKLILSTLASGEGDAAQVAELIGTVDGLRGATGVLGVRGGIVVRRPFLVKVEGGKVVPLTPVEPTTSPDDGERDH